MRWTEDHWWEWLLLAAVVAAFAAICLAGLHVVAPPAG